MKRGFTLIECLLASSILALLALALFEGVIVATRVSHENADLLAAEAVAWDAVWKRFNEDFDSLEAGEVRTTLSRAAAPQLARYDTPAVLTVTVGLTDEEGFLRLPQTMKRISADLEWGPADRRRRLSEGDGGKAPRVFRSLLGRTN